MLCCKQNSALAGWHYLGGLAARMFASIAVMNTASAVNWKSISSL